MSAEAVTVTVLTLLRVLGVGGVSTPASAGSSVQEGGQSWRGSEALTASLKPLLVL